ncbi:MAG: hypothetical protein ACJAT7_003018, partial [Psychromonas sp.]|uniref:hypothetical protein n=1 Tax=Psychromonas sp. TaxID=1884585 RepID=UPI0039E47683
MCVFTDGNIWQVKRTKAAGWLNYPTIPRINGTHETALDFSQLLYNLDEVKPVLHWLYQPISGTDALKFIKAIQAIFYAHSIISEGTNRTLLDIIDHVCRGINIKPDLQLTQLYLQNLGIKNYYQDGLENNLHELLMTPDMQFKELTETMTEFDSEMDHAAIHLLSALYTVARNFAEHRTKKKLTLSSAFSDELFNFINLGLQRNLQISLPAKSDNMSVNDIRESCKENWDSHAAEQHANLTEVISYLMGRMKK